MKKILSTLFVFVFAISVVLAASVTSNAQVNMNLNGSGSENVEAGVQAQTSGSTDEVLSRLTFQQRMRVGQEVRIQNARIMARENNRLRIHANGDFADTNMSLFQGENQALKAKLSNGRNAEIKIMPNTASETALQRLRLRVCNESNNCTIELREVGNQTQRRAAYEVQAQKRYKVLGLFRARARVRANVDAENGEVLSEDKPWWAAISTEVDTEAE